MTLPLNRFDPAPYRRAEITADALTDVARRHRRDIANLRAVGKMVEAAALEIGTAELERRATEMRGELIMAQAPLLVLMRRAPGK